MQTPHPRLRTLIMVSLFSVLMSACGGTDPTPAPTPTPTATPKPTPVPTPEPCVATPAIKSNKTLLPPATDPNSLLLRLSDLPSGLVRIPGNSPTVTREYADSKGYFVTQAAIDGYVFGQRVGYGTTDQKPGTPSKFEGQVLIFKDEASASIGFCDVLQRAMLVPTTTFAGLEGLGQQRRAFKYLNSEPNPIDIFWRDRNVILETLSSVGSADALAHAHIEESRLPA